MSTPTVRFTYPHPSVGGYGCNKPDDQSGEYVRLADHEKLQDEHDRLTSFLHAACRHPDYEYETTTGPRKAFDEHPPDGEGWERNTEEGDEGWQRFDYHEEAYRRRKIQKEG